jgi:hypothetical protein
MSSLTLLGDTSGSVVLDAPPISGSTTITLAPQSGTLNVGGPAFSATLSSNQSVSASARTKITFNTEQFDTNSCYDNSTNYRFTPTVAGYYQVNVFISWSGVGTTQGNVYLYKNGTTYANTLTPGSGYGYFNSVSALVQMNGTTDYLEAYCQNSSNESVTAGTASIFSGFLARTA